LGGAAILYDNLRVMGSPDIPPSPLPCSAFASRRTSSRRGVANPARPSRAKQCAICNRVSCLRVGFRTRKEGTKHTVRTMTTPGRIAFNKQIGGWALAPPWTFIALVLLLPPLRARGGVCTLLNFFPAVFRFFRSHNFTHSSTSRGFLSADAAATAVVANDQQR
jgi:hypothetical protein